MKEIRGTVSDVNRSLIRNVAEAMGYTMSRFVGESAVIAAQVMRERMKKPAEDKEGEK